MRIIYNKRTNPYFNLACEEYLIDNAKDDIFMLWRNESAVIIGKNQNAYAEINEAFVKEHGIKVVRRLTGGGAVFHDLGNVNYTFIVGEERTSKLDFERFCKPIIIALNNLGLDASLSGRNDIIANGKKISGTAQCVRNGKIMHHGCILYSADLSGVAGALNVNTDKMKSKGIKSVRSRVSNIADLLENPLPVESFIEYIMNTAAGERLDLSEQEEKEVSKLADGKYSTWEWNFGKSKKYEKTVSKRFDYGVITVNYTLDGGIVTDISFEGDYFGVRDTKELSEKIIGKRFERDIFNGIDVENYIFGASNNDLLSLLIQ